MVKKIIIVFLISVGLSQSPDSLFIKGVSQMEKGNYELATITYETILNQGFTHENLFYNLGNAYYKLGNYGNSIWAYEKALKIDPLDKDVEFNLALANTHVKDRINTPETFFLLRWYRVFKSSFTFFQFLSVSAFLILLAAFNYFLKKQYRVGLNWIPLQICLVSSLILHGIILDKYWDSKEINEGVIIDYEVPVFSGPFVRNDGVLFKIHEGIKVSISHDQGDWVEISLLDGKKGWVKANQLRAL